MSGITLENAQEHLAIWLKAEKAVSLGQSYRIGSREMRKADLGLIAERITFWNNKVIRLERARNKGSKRRIRNVIPIDI